MEEELATITFRLPKQMKDLLNEMAKEIDRTPSQLLRSAVTDYIQSYSAHRAKAKAEESQIELLSSSSADPKPKNGQKTAAGLRKKR